MNTTQINWLKSLDPEGMDGSLQNVLIRSDLQSIPFDKVAQVLIVSLMNDKASLRQENCKMSSILKKHNLYHMILED